MKYDSYVTLYNRRWMCVGIVCCSIWWYTISYKQQHDKDMSLICKSCNYMTDLYITNMKYDTKGTGCGGCAWLWYAVDSWIVRGSLSSQVCVCVWVGGCVCGWVGVCAVESWVVRGPLSPQVCVSGWVGEWMGECVGGWVRWIPELSEALYIYVYLYMYLYT